MRRWRGLILQVIALCVGAGCGGCEDERSFTGHYFEPYEYGIYEVVLEPSLEAPSQVDFGALGAREFASREVVIANVGRAPLLIKSMEITPLFRLRFSSFMEGGAPDSLAPGERITGQISFVSNAGEAERGVLRLETNDPKRPVHEIALNVNMSQPCLEITPSQRVDFGVGWSERSVTLHNCSRTAPTKLGLSIEGGGRLFDFSNFSEALLEPLEPDERREVGCCSGTLVRGPTPQRWSR